MKNKQANKKTKKPAKEKYFQGAPMTKGNHGRAGLTHFCQAWYHCVQSDEGARSHSQTEGWELTPFPFQLLILQKHKQLSKEMHCVFQGFL